MDKQVRVVVHYSCTNRMTSSCKILPPSVFLLQCCVGFYVQFADGVMLLLLIGQLEGFFIPLFDFNLTPVNESEMVRRACSWHRFKLECLNPLWAALPITFKTCLSLNPLILNRFSKFLEKIISITVSRLNKENIFIYIAKCLKESYQNLDC